MLHRIGGAIGEIEGLAPVLLKGVDGTEYGNSHDSQD